MDGRDYSCEAGYLSANQMPACTCACSLVNAIRRHPQIPRPHAHRPRRRRRQPSKTDVLLLHGFAGWPGNFTVCRWWARFQATGDWFVEHFMIIVLSSQMKVIILWFSMYYFWGFQCKISLYTTLQIILFMIKKHLCINIVRKLAPMEKPSQNPGQCQRAGGGGNQFYKGHLYF